jgi:hypothetical protein
MVYVYASVLFKYVCTTCVLSRVCGNRVILNPREGTLIYLSLSLVSTHLA